ncbi:MAG: hypothetical protein ACRBBO_03945 [Cognatishimia sp.]
MTWPFATAFTLAFMWGSVFGPLNDTLGFAPLPELDVHAVLFGNFFGSVVVIWSLARLYIGDPRMGVFDGIGRVLFSIAMINALMSGISPIVWGFLVPEVLFALISLFGAPKSLLRPA